MKRRDQISIEPGMIIFLFCIVNTIVVTLTGLNIILKVVIITIPFIYLIFKQLGYYYVSKAKKDIQIHRLEDARKYFDKALRHNLSSTKKLEIERLMFSIGDFAKASEVALSLRDDASLVVRRASKGDHALIRWKQGNIEEAIKILEELNSETNADNNLILNLSTMYLEIGRIQDAEYLLNDIDCHSSFGLIDNKIECYILLEKWNEAEDLSDILFPTDNFPKFPEAFLHRAVIEIHKGNIEDAVLLLSKAKNMPFSMFSLLSSEYIERIIMNLETEKLKDSYVDFLMHNLHLLFIGRIGV